MLAEHRQTNLHKRNVRLRDRLNQFVKQADNDGKFQPTNAKDVASYDAESHLASFLCLSRGVVGELRGYKPQLKEPPRCYAWYLVATIIGKDGAIPSYDEALARRTQHLQNIRRSTNGCT